MEYTNTLKPWEEEKVNLGFSTQLMSFRNVLEEFKIFVAAAT